MFVLSCWGSVPFSSLSVAPHACDQWPYHSEQMVKWIELSWIGMQRFPSPIWNPSFPFTFILTIPRGIPFYGLDFGFPVLLKWQPLASDCSKFSRWTPETSLLPPPLNFPGWSTSPEETCLLILPRHIFFFKIFFFCSILFSYMPLNHLFPQLLVYKEMASFSEF